MKHFLTLLLICIGWFVQAQEKPALPQGRQTVGVVLSGGGAKGFAHIGVLEILDSLGIPVDVIGGTSMGAIIGGLYAIGHTPDDLARISIDTEWDFITDPRPERRFLASYEKNTYERYILTLNVTGAGLQIPAGLNPGERIINILSNHTIGYHNPMDFTTEFPIPFVCVATELNTGEEKIMTSGILPLCMRSSMSIPSLFSPYFYDGEYLVDGGTVNNFPADHVRELGADIIIGVDVQTTFKDSLSNPTFLKVMEKTSMYMNAKTTREREALCNVIVSPDMSSFSVTSFKDAEAIIESGRRAARTNMDQLLEIRARLGGSQARTVQRFLPPKKIAFDEIRIKGLKKATRRSVIGNLGFYEGDTVTIDQINKAMLKLHGTNLFSLANYLTYEFQGKTVLEIKVLEKPSQLNARFGIRYDSYFETAALLNFSSRNQLFPGSYFSGDLVLGINPRVNVGYLYDAGALPGFGIDFRYWNYRSDLIYDQLNFGEYRTSDARTRIYATSSLSNAMALKLGAAFHVTNFYSSVSQIDELLEFADLRQENIELFFNASFDNRNRENFPTSGGQLNFLVTGIINTQHSVDVLPIISSIDFERNVKLSEKWTLRPVLFGSVSISAQELFYPNLVNFGGMGHNYINLSREFYGYDFSSGILGYPARTGDIEVLGFQSTRLAIDVQYEIFNKNFVTLGVNGAYLWDDLENVFQPSTSALMSGIMLEYGLNTLVGPISVALHRSFENNSLRGYINVGYWF